jgi:hypothetical protein
MNNTSIINRILFAVTIFQHRKRKIPQRYWCYATTMSHIIDSKPSYYEEADSHKLWRDVMMEEYQYITKNYVWDIVPRPAGNFVVTSKWIYKIKKIVDGRIERHKMIFVARRFFQVEGIDYEETFSSVARYTSI